MVDFLNALAQTENKRNALLEQVQFFKEKLSAYSSNKSRQGQKCEVQFSHDNQPIYQSRAKLDSLDFKANLSLFPVSPSIHIF